MSELLDDAEYVAIIGMAGRFPGADDLATLWRNLAGGVESITFFGDAELAAAGIDPAALHDPRYVKARPALNGVELFDAAFFGFTPREAELTDPQHRLFLECAWTALEDAGYCVERHKGRVGVYAGSSQNNYLLNNLYARQDFAQSINGLHVLTGNDKDYLATRVSYKLNLKGPSLTVQTACSTGLVAVHLACQSLLFYQCDLALAGAVAINVPQVSGYWSAEDGLTSPDGRCRPFDAAAQGTVFGSGVGAVVLKRLADARRDGDNVYAVIRGSAINNDGSDKVGYTAPSVDGQAEVIAAALALADVDPATIGYVEAHGTGTPLGDPIEVAALTKAYRAATDRSGFCALGSVKANLGHLDAAAGIAGLIKTVLALRARTLPPSPYFRAPNPQIDFAGTPFYIPTEAAPWPAAPGSPRRAGLSSFGMGGTNAHVILEEAPGLQPSAPAPAWQILPIAARTPAALDALAAQLHAYLAHAPEANLADVAYTLQTGRQQFAQRRCWVVRDRADACAALADPACALRADADDADPPADRAAQLAQLGRRWLAGEAIDWAAQHDHPRRRVALPTYPFERQRYWVDPPQRAPIVAAAAHESAHDPPAQPGHARPDLPTPYVAPHSATEQALAAIWQRVLGIAQVGVNDNFFELGGDSILTSQMVSRANGAGFLLSTALFMQRQTIAELAEALDASDGRPLDQNRAAPAPAAQPAIGPTSYTPADFPEADLSQAELEKFMALVRRR